MRHTRGNLAANQNNDVDTFDVPEQLCLWRQVTGQSQTLQSANGSITGDNLTPHFQKSATHSKTSLKRQEKGKCRGGGFVNYGVNWGLKGPILWKKLTLIMFFDNYLCLYHVSELPKTETSPSLTSSACELNQVRSAGCWLWLQQNISFSRKISPSVVFLVEGHKWRVKYAAFWTFFCPESFFWLKNKDLRMYRMWDI